MAAALTVGSLFAGIGGLELGLEQAGLGPVLWQVELDPFCRSVLAHHFPHARRFADVREVGLQHLCPVDVICGGFPCQDLSLAGSGRGLDGARSGLWGEFARIVGELRPRFVVVENVAALLARGVDRVLGDLAALGYDAFWDCIPASAVGAPHTRDRLFLVAWRIPDPFSDSIRLIAERGEGAAPAAESRDPVAAHVGAEGVADGDGGGRQALGLEGDPRRPRERCEGGHVVDGCRLPEWPPASDDLQSWDAVPLAAQPAVCRVADGVPAEVDRARLRAIGNAVVPAIGRLIGEELLAVARLL